MMMRFCPNSVAGLRAFKPAPWAGAAARSGRLGQADTGSSRRLQGRARPGVTTRTWAEDLASPSIVHEADNSSSSSSSSSRGSRLQARKELRAENKNKVLAAGFLALTISNMDKVNIAVAIIPMSQEFGWGPEAAGIIQGAFYAGFVVMQLPVGCFASSLGGRRVLPTGLATWSVATAMVPLMASSITSLALCRAAVGAGQSSGPSSVMDMVTRTASKAERARAVSLAYSGLHAGSIVGLILAPLLIQSIGWRSMFMMFGAAGLLWLAAFETFVTELSRSDPSFEAKLTAPPSSRLVPSSSACSQEDADALELRLDLEAEAAADWRSGQVQHPAATQQVPFRAFLRSPQVQGLGFTHFVNNWFYFTMLAWLPSYLVEELHYTDLSTASSLALLPPLAGIAFSNLGGQLADKLIQTGWPVRRVRLTMQSIATLGPAACLALVCLDHGGGHELQLLTAAMGVSSFSLAGLYCTHSDMSPKYAGALLGLTNTAGSLAASIGTFLVGYILERQHSWELALLLPNATLLCLSAACYALRCSSEPQDFDAGDQSPLAAEALLEAPKAVLGAAGKAVRSVSEAVQSAMSKVTGKQESVAVPVRATRSGSEQDRRDSSSNDVV